MTLDARSSHHAESVRVVARRGELQIVQTRHGLVMAAAGVDASNTEPGTIALLPVIRMLRRAGYASTFRISIDSSWPRSSPTLPEERGEPVKPILRSGWRECE